MPEPVNYSFADAFNLFEGNWIVDENGSYYDASHIEHQWYEGGDVQGTNVINNRGAAILHIDPEDLMPGTTTTHNTRFVLENGNYLEIDYTIQSHNDGVANVFDGIQWTVHGYYSDGEDAHIGSSGFHSMATVKAGQYQAWLISGADLTFVTSADWTEQGNQAYEGNPQNYNYKYGTAFIPSAYHEGIGYPLGGTFFDATPQGCLIDYGDAYFEMCPDPNNADDDSVPATRLMNWINGSTESKDEETPGEDTDAGEDGRPGGGGGTGYLHEDNGIPGLPTLSVANSGFCGIYHVTGAQLTSLSQFLWGNSFYTSVLKNFASPAENIIMFGIVPWSNFNASSHNICIGNVDTGIAAPRLNTTLYELDCGTISVGEPTDGTFADYEPYTRYWIFLPYIGMVDLPADDVALGGQVAVIYHFDVFSGACVAFVRCKTPKGWFTLGEYNGNLLTNLPISGSNFLSMYMNLASSVLGAATSAAEGNYLGATVDLASGIISAKPEYMRSGSISNVAGMLGHQKPFLVRAVPEIARTTHFRTMQGYASKLEGLISSHTGYLRTQYTNLTGIAGATNEELDEIKQMLESGIYV